MTDFERELEKAAEQYRDADLKQNPNGYTVAPYVNEETTSTAFEAGARWALKSSAVKQMADALRKVCERNDIPSFWITYGECSMALAAYNEAIRERGE